MFLTAAGEEFDSSQREKHENRNREQDGMGGVVIERAVAYQHGGGQAEDGDGA